jgi:kynurenine formamidase
VAQHGYNLLALELGSQAGTHVDAPYHVDDHLPRLDDLPLEVFTGPAVVSDLRHLGPSAPIREGDLAGLELSAGTVLLLCTGWSRHWGQPAYAEHPWLHPDTAAAVLTAGVRTLGIDAPSIDPTDTSSVPVLDAHRVLAGGHAVIAENLTNLESLLDCPGRRTVWLLPLPLAGADGSPVRAMAQVADALG